MESPFKSLQPPTAAREIFCFSISLQATNSDIALFLSPIYNPGPPRVARNSLQAGQWGAEESQSNLFPFSPSQEYDILILCEADHFKIAVNNQHFTEFSYRLPLSTITHINIQGDTSINSIKFETQLLRIPGVGPLLRSINRVS
ncbi:GALE5 [Cordylochernes scorpioides]|uniref:Galectin n=1 Tax=Cordylochernes scorpioides TaxID=51811 RepID=A0ABY6LFX0_9ARAC|nr:GALE5 [Cordylochernes scorpioides]